MRAILDWRDLNKDIAFLRAVAGRHRIHPCWGQTRSATSRIYARNPAVQNTRRDLRRLFVPAPGHVFLKADYSQAQMRIIAHLSQDPELCRVFRERRDIHAETSVALGLNDRDTAKQINFAVCFGMEAPGLSRKINQARGQQGRDDRITVEQAQAYINGFYGRFPNVQKFFLAEWARLKSMPMQDRISESITGRVRRFNRPARSGTEREFRVTWPQQIEADLTKTAMLRLDRAFRERRLQARICMMIHDSVWVEAPAEEADQVRSLIEQVMASALTLTVPLEVDLE